MPRAEQARAKLLSMLWDNVTSANRAVASISAENDSVVQND